MVSFSFMVSQNEADYSCSSDGRLIIQWPEFSLKISTFKNLLFTFQGLATCSKQAPVFTWLSDQVIWLFETLVLAFTNKPWTNLLKSELNSCIIGFTRWCTSSQSQLSWWPTWWCCCTEIFQPTQHSERGKRVWHWQVHLCWTLERWAWGLCLSHWRLPIWRKIWGLLKQLTFC